MNESQLDLNTFNELKSLLEDEFAEFLSVFLEDAESELQYIGQGIEQNDHNAISAAAHKLKSSAAYIGALELQELSMQLELENKDTMADNISDVYDQTNSAFTELKNHLLN